jgi:hypothetical protein
MVITEGNGSEVIMDVYGASGIIIYCWTLGQNYLKVGTARSIVRHAILPSSLGMQDLGDLSAHSHQNIQLQNLPVSPFPHMPPQLSLLLLSL